MFLVFKIFEYIPLPCHWTAPYNSGTHLHSCRLPSIVVELKEAKFSLRLQAVAF